MNLEKRILEGFERLTAKWSLLRDEISLNVRGEFSESEFADESLSSDPEVKEVEAFKVLIFSDTFKIDSPIGEEEMRAPKKS